MTLTLAEEDILRMRGIVLDGDSNDSLIFISELLMRIISVVLLGIAAKMIWGLLGAA